MSVQSVQDNGSVKGSLDLADHVTVSANDKSATITIKDYLTAQSQYDAGESPNKRLAHVLQQSSWLPINSNITSFVNDQTKTWNTSNSTVVATTAGNSKATQCSQGTTLVVASGSVTKNFCIDNEATQNVKGQFPTWSMAKGFCEAAGKFLLTYEQHQLGAKSTDRSVVRNSGDWEWVLKSNSDNSEGQAGGFFVLDRYRDRDDEYLNHVYPDERGYKVAFRCGGFPSSRD